MFAPQMVLALVLLARSSGNAWRWKKISLRTEASSRAERVLAAVTVLDAEARNGRRLLAPRRRLTLDGFRPRVEVGEKTCCGQKHRRVPNEFWPR